MPIRSPRGRSAAYRPIWQWPLRSPGRLGLTTLLVVAVAVGISLSITALAGDPQRGLLAGIGSADPAARVVPRTSGPGAPGPGGVPVRTALPPVPELAPSNLPLAQAPAAALEVAARWTAAWIRPPAGTTAQQWIDGLRPSTTEEYLGVLGGVDPANIPATRVTGEPRAVRVTPDSVDVEVPTDSLTLVVLVVDAGDGWRVAGHDRV